MAFNFYNGKKCRYGKLKNPTKRRACRRRPRGRIFGKKVKCKHGRLKSPIGGRICRKAPKRRGAVRSPARMTKARQESWMWKQYRAGRL